MARPCKWCGRIFTREEDVRDQERFHRDIDRWTSLEHDGMDSGHYWELEDSHEPNTGDGEVAQQEGSGVISRGEAVVNTCTHLRNDLVRKSFKCEICGKGYTEKSSVDQHKRAIHSSETFACCHCHKTFGFARSRNRHQRNCQGLDHTCATCQRRCTTASGLLRHLKVHQLTKSQSQRPKADFENFVLKTPTTRKAASSKTRPSQFSCRRCTEVFSNRHELYLHGLRHHYSQGGGALQSRPWRPEDVTPYQEDQALRQVYEANAPLILVQHQIGPMRSVFNFPLTNEVNINQLMGLAEDIYQRQQRAFRLNIVFGTILQHRETGRYRYFVPYRNNSILERPLYISKRDDLQRLRRELEQKDFLQELLNLRPDTKWVQC